MTEDQHLLLPGYMMIDYARKAPRLCLSQTRKLSPIRPEHSNTNPRPSVAGLRPFSSQFLAYPAATPVDSVNIWSRNYDHWTPRPWPIEPSQRSPPPVRSHRL